MKTRKHAGPEAVELPSETQTLSPPEARFVEQLGLWFERQNVPRIGGRLLGLMMIAEGPISLDRMAKLLRVSRASVSTNLRLLTASGICKHFGVPGDRRHYYVFAEDAWVKHLESGARSIEALVQICRGGLTAVPGHHATARARVQESLAFLEFEQNEIANALVRWRRQLRSPARSRRTR